MPARCTSPGPISSNVQSCERSPAQSFAVRTNPIARSMGSVGVGEYLARALMHSIPLDDEVHLLPPGKMLPLIGSAKLLPIR